MIRRLCSTPKLRILNFRWTNLARDFQSAKSEVQQGETNTKRFNTFEVYYLKKDMSMMRRRIKASTMMSIYICIAAELVHLTTSLPYVTKFLLLCGSVPIVRAWILAVKSRKIVSCIWLSKNKELIQIVYGPQLTTATGKASGIRLHDASGIANLEGFQVCMDFTDSNGKVHKDLKMLLHSEVCFVDNSKLLECILAGKERDLQDFQFSGETDFSPL